MEPRFGDERLPQRFWDKVIPEPNSGCWLWTGAVKAGGYGDFRLTRQRRNESAYRFAYETLVGPVPDGLHCDHLCRTPPCVNPVHIEPVTPRENSLRGISPSAQNARKTHCDAGHLLGGANLYEPARGGRHCRECQRLRNLVSGTRRRVRLRSEGRCVTCGAASNGRAFCAPCRTRASELEKAAYHRRKGMNR